MCHRWHKSKHRREGLNRHHVQVVRHPLISKWPQIPFFVSCPIVQQRAFPGRIDLPEPSTNIHKSLSAESLSTKALLLVGSRASIFGCLSCCLYVCLWLQREKPHYNISVKPIGYGLKPIVMVDLYRSYRDSQLVGMSGYSKESLLERKGLHAINRNNDNNDDDMMMVLQRMASDMKKHMLDLNRWPIRSSKGTQFQLAMTCVDTNLGRGWYNSCFHRGPGMEPWRGNDPMAGRAAASNSHLKDEFVRTLAS